MPLHPLHHHCCVHPVSQQPLTTPVSFELYIHVDTIMPLGILEPRAKKVPGTANVFDQEWKRDPTLKRDKTGNIILVPQPSEDPNDPLVRYTTTPSRP
jgi:hypothetical protein